LKDCIEVSQSSPFSFNEYRKSVWLCAILKLILYAFALLIFNHYSTLHGDPMVGRRIVFASFAINS